MSHDRPATSADVEQGLHHRLANQDWHVHSEAEQLPKLWSIFAQEVFNSAKSFRLHISARVRNSEDVYPLTGLSRLAQS